MDRYKCVRVFLALLATLLVSCALASTTVQGTVTVQGPDAPSGPISGAFVMVSRPNFPNQILASVKTAPNGSYSITGLAAGNYEVQFSATGFDTGVMAQHHLRDGRSYQLNAQLVPLLTDTVVPTKDEKNESEYTITNPNNFTVDYAWRFSGRGISGTGAAPPGTSTLQTNASPHTEDIELFVDGVQVSPPQPSDVPPPTDSNQLTGLVETSADEPLGGVKVTLNSVQGGRTATTYTLSNGSYLFHNEPSGFYTLTYTASGYYAQTQVVDINGTVDAPTVFLVAIAPPPTATLMVTVDNPGGTGAPNVTVTVAYANAETVMGATDGTGYVEFTNQPVGIAAAITATANDGTGRTVTQDTSGLTVGNNSITLTLPPIPTGGISGTVTGMNNNHLAGVDVVVLNASNAVVASTTTNSQGGYTVSGLSPGTYSMTFSLASYVTGTAGGVIVKSGATTVESISLITVASTQATVVVNVTDGSSPAVNASVSISYANGTTSATLDTNASGQVTFTGQPANIQGTVTAIAGDGTGRSVSSSPQTFPAGSTTTVSLALPPVNNAIISGAVADSTTGSGIANVTVTVTDSNGNVDGTAITNQQGQYSVGGLGLQTYSVAFSVSGYQGATASAAGNTTLNISLIPMDAAVNVLVEDTFGNAIGNASVFITYVGNEPVSTGTTNSSGMAAFSNQLVGLSAVISVTTADGRTASLSDTFSAGVNNAAVKVVSTVGVVSGVVIDNSTSLPLPGVNVAVVDYNNNPVTTVSTNGQGQYVVQDLNPGSYSFTYSLSAYQTMTLTVPVSANMTSTQNAALMPAPGSIQGQVTGSISQSPVPGATIALQGPASISTTTDSNGNYAFTGIPPGSYSGTLTSGIFFQAVQATVTPGQTTTLNLVLDTTSVAGRVADQNGDLLQGAQVILTGAGFTSSTVVTDSEGDFVVNRESNTGSMVLTITYTDAMGNTYSTTDPITVDSTPPEDSIGTIVLTLGDLNSANVAVSVTLSGGPVTGAEVTINYADGTVVGPIQTSNGAATFTAQPPNEPATVSATYVDGTGMVFTGGTGTQTFSAGSNNVSFPLFRADNSQSAYVEVTVVDQNGNPLANASVSISYTNGATSATQSTDNNGNVSYLSQQAGVGATINVSYVDGQGNTWTGSLNLPSGFSVGNVNEQVQVAVG